MPHKKPSRQAPDTLADYRKKRAAGATPEPFGGTAAARPGLFVVQKHSARRLHYDLRLEMDGVLRSWAVPKGPSLDPNEKRLAVLTEDHPLEYGDWEGVIPADNYGAGAVILWDRGPTVHHLDPVEGTKEGKLLFELKGFKLRGLWTLVKTSRSEKEWLLIKKPDGEATGEDATDLDPHSVMSGLTIEQMRDGSTVGAEVSAELDQLGAPRRKVDAAKVKPMLATLEREPFSRDDWLFEIKYDGYRLAAERQGAPASSDAAVHLRYRSGLDATSIYPDLSLALRALPYDHLLFDGELVVLDDAGKPSFSLLQQRARLSRPLDVDRAAARLPATYFVFDLLAFGQHDLRPLPLIERKRLLRKLLPPRGPIRFADHIAERGLDFYSQVRDMDLEGMVAKRAGAPYRAGRSASWIKIRAERSGDFAIVGYTTPKGSRAGFGALHLAVADAEGALTYAGRVGTGFNSKQLDQLRAQLEPFKQANPAFAGAPKKTAEHNWVSPQLVAEVNYTEYTKDGHLRHPVFVRLREDKGIRDCQRDDLPPAPQVEETPVAAPPAKVPISRPEKVFWPDEGITKGDLIGYYRAVAPRLLPFLRDRPLVLDRYPDGYQGKSFFQKNAPAFAPDWVRTEPVFSGDEDEKETSYFICDSLEMLTYLINSGAIPLHVWSSRIAGLQRPDWSILDLDAKDATFDQVVTVAKAIHKLCKEIGLPTVVKTSGATGMHVLIPLGGQCTHDQSKQLAFLLAQLVSQQLPKVASVARSPSRREGLVYVDAIQNGYGKLLVSPFSVRPRPGATVSTPLHWREVNSKLDPTQFTVKTVPKRLERQRRDPWKEVLASRPNLAAALGKLTEML